MLENYQRVYAAVDLSAILYNMERMHGAISPQTKMIGVIKTDGYGHGAVPIGRELEKLPYVFGYATATAEEAFILRRAGLTKPILILGYTFPYSYEELVLQEIRPAVFRRDALEALNACAERLGKKALVHVKVDTGMSRICKGGRERSDSGAFTAFRVYGVCTGGGAPDGQSDSLETLFQQRGHSHPAAGESLARACGHYTVRSFSLRGSD